MPPSKRKTPAPVSATTFAHDNAVPAIPEKELARLRELIPGLGTLEHLDTVASSVTTNWGVTWDEEMVARDLMQNFRDANRNEIDGIAIRPDGLDVTIGAPAAFNLTRLFYLGSEKSGDDIGQYGEGFKAAAVALLRDFKVHPIMASGDQIVRIRVSDKTVEGTALKPIIYDFYRCSTTVEGSVLALLNCSPKLVAAVRESLRHFFWPRHPALGEMIMQSRNLDVYRLQGEGAGFGFYGGLLRCTLPNLPLVFNYKGADKNIDKRIAQDRDRKAFDEKVLNSFYTAVVRNLDEVVLREIVTLLKPLWARGHAILPKVTSGLAACVGVHHTYGTHNPQTLERLRARFKDLIEHDRYFAKPEYWGGRDDVSMLQAARELKRQQRIELPSYFHDLGVHSPGSYAEELNRKEIEALHNVAHRSPSPAEQRSVEVLVEGVRRLYAPLLALLQHKSYEIVVVQSDDLLGMMKDQRKRTYNDVSVLLNASLFVAPMGRALATLLHEFAHVFGHDGDREFTDALTEVIESIIEQRAQLDALHTQWAACVDAVRLERAKVTGGQVDAVESAIDAMSAEDLRALVKGLPRDVVAPGLKLPTVPAPKNGAKRRVAGVAAMAPPA